MNYPISLENIYDCEIRLQDAMRTGYDADMNMNKRCQNAEEKRDATHQ